MKDYIVQLIEGADNGLLKICLVREYLQARILQSLQEHGVFIHWAFVGGTALRFLYSIPRFSEDLDFSLVGSAQDSDFAGGIRRVERDLEIEGYALKTTTKIRNAIASASIRFPGLLYELGLSPHRNHVFSIKIELDMNPPNGAGFETTMVRRHVILNLMHHDKSSLLAGKINALLYRPWGKGRDLYDLMWYLTDRSWPEPNIPFLESALDQTEWPGPRITRANWRNMVKDRLKKLDWEEARADVRPFLEKEREIELVTFDNFAGLLRKPRAPAG